MREAVRRTKTSRPEDLRSVCSTCEPAIRISLGLLCRKTEKALIEKRRDDRDDCADDERGNAITLLQLREIVQEKFEDGDAKQTQPLISRRPCGLTDSND